MSEKITILYVDDEPTNVLLFKVNFQRKYNVITALSGFEGLEKLRAHSEILIVISDMKMPGISGLEFIRLAKIDFPNIIYFILTGFDITPEIEEALSQKLIHKYYSKPFNIDEIEDSINLALNLRKQ
jgi:two-component system response regulator (stage 0 sporulation protein F)